MVILSLELVFDSKTLYMGKIFGKSSPPHPFLLHLIKWRQAWWPNGLSLEKSPYLTSQMVSFLSDVLLRMLFRSFFLMVHGPSMASYSSFPLGSHSLNHPSPSPILQPFWSSYTTCRWNSGLMILWKPSLLTYGNSWKLMNLQHLLHAPDLHGFALKSIYPSHLVVGFGWVMIIRRFSLLSCMSDCPRFVIIVAWLGMELILVPRPR